ncbi:hypothetical protein [Burkholderia vietnamiensis]|uniref:hypothetical protein n=1 Tax=Burkholderia vietnamiensis TaxID=60552 RepID=UPI000758BDD1|nr:hypothetical protein [Burkholderia vietnamiensis]KVR94933.1 hypothetical protein WK29_06205 [Burkholderia vietnamiensis]HDR8930285.1 hypothetical protein [Burkholderia vietnamiensis]
MPNFVTRIELHDATWENYDDLHTRMEGYGFSRTIPGINGERYTLPTATYYGESDTMTGREVLELARQAANATGKANSVITTQGDSNFYLYVA